MSQDLNPKIPGADRIEVTPAVENSDQENITGKPFSSYMQESPTSSIEKGQNISPMDLARQSVLPGSTPTLDSVNSQMQTASSSLGDLQNKLNTPNLKLKPSQKYLLRNKLTEANSQIRDVAGKAGVEVGPPVSPLSRNNPVSKFLALVTDGEQQINQAQQLMTDLAKKGGSLRPADLLLMQVKLTKAQQEIEYSSVLLSKAVDDIKVLFNVQI